MPCESAIKMEFCLTKFGEPWNAMKITFEGHSTEVLATLDAANLKALEICGLAVGRINEL